MYRRSTLDQPALLLPRFPVVERDMILEQHVGRSIDAVAYVIVNFSAFAFAQAQAAKGAPALAVQRQTGVEINECPIAARAPHRQDSLHDVLERIDLRVRCDRNDSSLLFAPPRENVLELLRSHAYVLHFGAIEWTSGIVFEEVERAIVAYGVSVTHEYVRFVALAHVTQSVSRAAFAHAAHLDLVTCRGGKLSASA